MGRVLPDGFVSSRKVSECCLKLVCIYAMDDVGANYAGAGFCTSALNHRAVLARLVRSSCILLTLPCLYVVLFHGMWSFFQFFTNAIKYALRHAIVVSARRSFFSKVAKKIAKIC